MGPLHGVSISFVQRFFSASNHLCFTRMASFSLRYRCCQVGTTSPSGQPRHYRLALVLSYFSSLFRDFSAYLMSHPASFCSVPLQARPSFFSFFSISKLAGLAVKPWPFPSSRKDNEATHPLMLSPFSFRKAFLAWPTFLAWTSPFLSVKLTLSSPCSRSNPSLRCQGAALSHFDSL